MSCETPLQIIFLINIYKLLNQNKHGRGTKQGKNKTM